MPQAAAPAAAMPTIVAAAARSQSAANGAQRHQPLAQRFPAAQASSMPSGRTPTATPVQYWRLVAQPQPSAAQPQPSAAKAATGRVDAKARILAYAIPHKPCATPAVDEVPPAHPYNNPRIVTSGFDKSLKYLLGHL